MHLMITGANGFVGEHLVNRLLADECTLPFTRLTLVDTCFGGARADARVRQIEGSIATPGVLQQALSEPVDLVFHLASIAGGRAEQDFALGLDVNLQATLALLELLRGQARPARLVYSSTIAVFGAQLPALVDDSTAKRPGLSYGAHKLCCEILIDDYSRRGWLDGCTVRLPGIVARPPVGSGLLSAFMSEIFWRVAEGRPFVSPVSPRASMWMMSVECCVDNLLTAATMPASRLATRRDYTLPALVVTMAELVAALTAAYGAALVSYEPNEALEAAFGRLPPLDCSSAEAAGFRHDGTLDTLIRNAML